MPQQPCNCLSLVVSLVRTDQYYYLIYSYIHVIILDVKYFNKICYGVEFVWLSCHGNIISQGYLDVVRYRWFSLYFLSYFPPYCFTIVSMYSCFVSHEKLSNCVVLSLVTAQKVSNIRSPETTLACSRFITCKLIEIRLSHNLEDVQWLSQTGQSR